MTYAAITGWGACMPPAILTNDDLSTFLDTSDEWITTRTGMKERRISHVSAVELSTVAASRALACAGLTAKDVDLIVYAAAASRSKSQTPRPRCSWRSARSMRRRWI